jgi:hypothetical protein
MLLFAETDVSQIRAPNGPSNEATWGRDWPHVRARQRPFHALLKAAYSLRNIVEPRAASSGMCVLCGHDVIISYACF